MLINVATWTNGESDDEGLFDYDVTTKPVKAKDVPKMTESEVQLRLLETINHNLASLAESAERIAKALDAVARAQIGG